MRGRNPGGARLRALTLGPCQSCGYALKAWWGRVRDHWGGCWQTPDCGWIHRGSLHKAAPEMAAGFAHREGASPKTEACKLDLRCDDSFAVSPARAHRWRPGGRDHWEPSERPPSGGGGGGGGRRKPGTAGVHYLAFYTRDGSFWPAC